MESTSDLEKLLLIIDKRSNANTDWMRHLLLLFSAIFGILVALPQHTPLVCRSARYILPVAITTIALGILCGLISAYEEVYSLKKLQKLWSEEIIRSQKECAKCEPVVVPRARLFVVSETTCYVLFCLALLLLSLYSILAV